MANVTMRQMLEAGVHFGHQTRYWNPKMAPYIFGARGKIHIINLEKTLPLLNDAMNFISKLAAKRGTIMFVGTKRAASASIEEEAQRCGMPYVSHRWLGGMLTNYKTIRQSVKRLVALESMADVETLSIDDAYREDHDEGDIGIEVAADQLAYIYFTSGSTGEPKGAMCEHAGMVNHLYAKIDDLEITEGQVVDGHQVTALEGGFAETELEVPEGVQFFLLFHLVQRFDPGLDKVGQARFGPEAGNEQLDFLAAALVIQPRFFIDFFVLGDLIVIFSGVSGDFTGFTTMEADDVGDGLIHERAVMGDQQELSRPGLQKLDHPANGGDIQVVGRFVQQEQIGLRYEHLGQIEPDLVAAGEHLGRQPQVVPRQRFTDARLHRGRQHDLPGDARAVQAGTVGGAGARLVEDRRRQGGREEQDAPAQRGDPSRGAGGRDRRRRTNDRQVPGP